MPIVSSFKKLYKRIYSSEKNARSAYNIWSATYDNHDGNLMLDLDEKIFSCLLHPIDIRNKSVVDIGCGTGRHWEKLYAKHPLHITGYDVSEGMLQKLKQKYPQANTHLITNDFYQDEKNASYDLLICTLTIAYIKNIEEAIKTWCSLVKKDGDIILTDFHPEALEKGGKRTFVHDQISVTVKNYIHSLETIKRLFFLNGFICAHREEIIIDEPVKNYYTEQNALHVFERFKGVPVIFGMHLKRRNDTE